MGIRGEQTGTEELIKDGLFLWASLLSDPETMKLADPVRKEIDALKAADYATREAEEEEIGKDAVQRRIEFAHDNEQRDCELDVLKAEHKNRTSDGYRAVYPNGFSALIQLSGKQQELTVSGMVKALEAHHPELAKQYKKKLTDLAQKATQAEHEWEKADSRATLAFQSERLARAGLVRVMQRTEGALLSLFPGDRARVRSYFRARRQRHDSHDSGPTDPTPTAT